MSPLRNQIFIPKRYGHDESLPESFWLEGKDCSRDEFNEALPEKFDPWLHPGLAQTPFSVQHRIEANSCCNPATHNLVFRQHVLNTFRVLCACEPPPAESYAVRGEVFSEHVFDKYLPLIAFWPLVGKHEFACDLCIDLQIQEGKISTVLGPRNQAFLPWHPLIWQK